MSATVFEQWAIVELMGHVRLAGKVTEEERFGAKLGRIDIPKDSGFYTQYFGGSSVYRVTPVTEAIARAVAKSAPEPVSRWEIPSMQALEAPMEQDIDGDEHEQAGHSA